MSDYITLIGTEQVARAAQQMQSAAEDMCRAASYLNESVDRLARILDEHATRIERAMKGEPS